LASAVFVGGAVGNVHVGRGKGTGDGGAPHHADYAVFAVVHLNELTGYGFRFIPEVLPLEVVGNYGDVFPPGNVLIPEGLAFQEVKLATSQNTALVCLIFTSIRLPFT
jgi:hypothetical protein